MDVGNVKNPFLFDDPGPVSDAGDAAGNPFLNGSTFDYTASYTGINPFSDQIDESTANAMDLFGDQPAYAPEINPFSDSTFQSNTMFSNVEISPGFDFFGSNLPAEPVLPDDLFGSMTSKAKPPPPRPPSPGAFISDNSSHILNSGDSPGRPPPPRPPPPSKETKDLLQTVIGAMEATTDTLQDKLNTTRTPCPSPSSGAQGSRSPTPDIQITSPEKEPDVFSTIFGQTIELSDQEVDESHTDSNVECAQEVKESTAVSSEEIDLFGEPVVQAKPKTTQDILSLFNKPTESDMQQFDLLSGDLLTGGENDAVKEEELAHTTSNSDKQDVVSEDVEPRIDTAKIISNEAESPDAVDLPCKEEGQTAEVPGSPEQISEKSDSEPTVIEATGAMKRDSCLTESEIENTCFNIADEINMTEHDSSGPFSVISTGIPSEEVPPIQLTEDRESNESPGSLDFPPPPEPSDIFGISEVPNEAVTSFELEQLPTSVFGAEPIETEISVSEVAPATEDHKVDAEGAYNTIFNDAPCVSYNDSNSVNIFGDSTFPAAPETECSDSFGDFAATENEPNAFKDTPFGVFAATENEPNAFKDTPFGDFAATENEPNAFKDTLFGDIVATENEPNSIKDTPFGVISPAESASEPMMSAPITAVDDPSVRSSVSDAFGDTSTAPNLSNVFGDSSIQQTATETKVSNAFELFGGSAPPPTSALGAETTGAALFETSAPAPNVGMSLFGGGQEAALDIFAESDSNKMVNPFAPSSPVAPAVPKRVPVATGTKIATDEEFDAFSARFDNVTAVPDAHEALDPFASSINRAPSPWGEDASFAKAPDAFGFGDTAPFDAFLAMNEPPPVPQSTPRKAQRQTSADSDDAHMSVVIKPTSHSEFGVAPPGGVSPVPVLAPPPATVTAAFSDAASRFNPFDRGTDDAFSAVPTDFGAAIPMDSKLERTESQETPPTPLFEEDQSVPLEPFIRTHYDGRTWEMYLRQPNKKKITGQRFWKKIYVKLTDAGALQLFNNQEDKEPFQELPLQPSYSVSDIGAQQFDQFGKIFTVKLQYIFYKERPGVRPGQISKAERITTKLSKFAQYAIAGDYEGVKEFASDVRKLGMPVEHAPQISQLLKLGTQNYEDLKLFASLIEEYMFRLNSSRDRALTYKTEEVQLTAVDELFVEQDLNGVVLQMVARVRIFFLGFLSGMPEVDLGVNDLRKQGREVVGRHDIIPIVTEEWIRLEAIEFHNTVDKEEFEKSKHIKYKPPDGCYIELMRFRVRPPKNRELPLRVTTKMTIQGRKIDINCEIIVPGFCGRKLGQVPCEDVAVRFPLPECWIYLFRVEKHFRYGSVKSAHRRTGKVKGIERFKGAVESADAALMEVTSGQAKYEHQHRAIVWRMARLPKEGQGAYTVHTFTCKMQLTTFDQMPEALDKFCVVEFTMPATTVSHCVMRSVSVTSEDPPEKYVRYLARHEYKIEMEFSSGSGPNEYIAATMKDESIPKTEPKKQPQPVPEESSSDESL